MSAVTKGIGKVFRVLAISMAGLYATAEQNSGMWRANNGIASSGKLCSWKEVVADKST